MANLRRQFTYNLAPGLVLVHAEIAFSSLGAVTLTHGAGHGVKSVSRTGAGAVTVNLENPYLALRGFNAGVEGSTNDGYMVKLVEDAVAGYATVNEDTVDGVADGYVKIKVVDDSSAAKDPYSHTIWLQLALSTSEQG